MRKKRPSQYQLVPTLTLLLVLLVSCDSQEAPPLDNQHVDKKATSPTPSLATSEAEATYDATISSEQGKEDNPERDWHLIIKVPEQPVVLEDLSQVQVREGVEPPLLGTTIYPIGKLPKAACGQFWIFFGDGFIDKVYACNHEEGEHPHQ